MINNFFGWRDASRTIAVTDGDTLSLGRHELSFVTAPMVHWPEVIMSFDSADRILFTADAFGSFGALNGSLFADEVNFERDVLGEARRYYTNIVGKYGDQVCAALGKVAAVKPAMLAPLHGHVWRENLDYVLDKYTAWANFEPEEHGVLIAYASVYGNTETAANILSCRLREMGVATDMFDVSVASSSEVVSAAFRFSHLVFASTTYNTGIFITMDELLRDISSHGLRNRAVALIENGSWAPRAAKLMREILEQLPGFRFMGEMRINSGLTPEKLTELDELASVIAQDVKG
jgi:flavorubredoxin